MLRTVGIRNAHWEFVIEKYRIILTYWQDSNIQRTMSIISILYFFSFFFLHSSYLKEGRRNIYHFCKTILIDKCFITREKVFVVQRKGCSHLLSGNVRVDTVQTTSVLKENQPWSLGIRVCLTLMSALLLKAAVRHRKAP